MFDKKFLKSLTVLYVEDDQTIQNSLGSILKKIFKEIIICNDGAEGLLNYKRYTEEFNLEFDVIISDINMPNMNGLDMIEKIKELNPFIPSIMTTAHGEANFLLQAIKINVNGYTLKPIDTKDLLITVQHHCSIIRNQKIIEQNEKELSQYMEFINSISTILKLDSEHNIIEANQFFCGMIELEEEKLINTNIINYIHQDSISKSFNLLKDSIKKGDSWKGKIKFTTEENTSFFLRTTNIPQKDVDTNEIKGYISIGFLADDEEAEKQETISKAKTNLLEQKHKVLNLNRQLQTLLKNSSKITSSNDNSDANIETITLLSNALESERRKSQDLNKQITHYETVMQDLKKRLSNVAGYEQTKRIDNLKKHNEIMKENAQLKDKIIELQAEITRITPKLKYI